MLIMPSPLISPQTAFFKLTRKLNMKFTTNTVHCHMNEALEIQQDVTLRCVNGEGGQHELHQNQVPFKEPGLCFLYLGCISTVLFRFAVEKN